MVGSIEPAVDGDNPVRTTAMAIRFAARDVAEDHLLKVPVMAV
jgi:hypothetical protein